MTSASVPTVLIHNIRALSNYQIEAKMQHRKYFKGVYDADSLPRRTFTYPWAIIVNTKKDTVPSAGHWTAFVFDKFGQGYYFDSYGLPPPHKFWKNYLHKNSRGNVWFYNRVIVQRYDTNTCGYLCMDYIVQKLRKPMLNNQSVIRRLGEYKAYHKFVNS